MWRNQQLELLGLRITQFLRLSSSLLSYFRPKCFAISNVNYSNKLPMSPLKWLRLSVSSATQLFAETAYVCGRWVGSKLTYSSLLIPIPNTNAYHVQKNSCKSKDNTHICSSVLLSCFVKLYFWIVLRLYCLLFHVRQWRKWTHSAFIRCPV